jgi:hypothetical protein
MRMKPLSAAVLMKLDLAGAISAESTCLRNLLPIEPGWDRLSAQASTVVAYCTSQLKAGYHASPEVQVAARKPGHGIRPVPYWGSLERIIYRALTDALLKGHPPMDRSTEAYLRFVGAPVSYANELQKKQGHDRDPAERFFYLQSPVKYVVKSDITAFYQFIDHAVLAEELLLLGADFELIDALMDLLSDVQGRSYGLPQLLDSSDALSEIYIDRVERDLIRSGIAVWRYNDDFRIACVSYSDALAAIEALDRATRATGLVISENKTITVRFLNYMLDVLGKERSEVGETISPDEVEDIVGDYTDDFTVDDVDSALGVVQRANVNDANDGISLKNIAAEDVRILRRALNGLAKAKDARGVEDMLRLAIYVPSLTPSIMRYLGAVVGSEPEKVAGVIDQLMQKVSQNDWQRLWLVDTMHQFGLLATIGDQLSDSRVEWVRELRDSTRNAPLLAVTTRALAAAGRLELDVIMADTEHAPAALLTYYATAAFEAVATQNSGGQPGGDKQLGALAKSSVLHKALLTAI